MSASALAEHPIVACAADISRSLAEVAEVQPTYMSSSAKRAALVAVTDAERRLEELKLRLIAASDDVAEEDGARDVAAWMASNTRTESMTARSEQRLARSIDSRWQRVAAGMAAGVVSFEQAQVIVAGLENVPARVGVEVVAQAEAQMVEYAERFKPSELRRLVRHILDVVAPEIADAEAARMLEREEQKARQKTSLRSKRIGDGMARTTILHPEASMDRLHSYLASFTSPRKPDALSGDEDRIPYPQRLGQAFTALLEHLDPAKLPDHGGAATGVLVTIPLASLMTDLATAGLLDGDVSVGDNLSASEARRLACNNKIIPVVLGGRGEILDLGRSRRLFSSAQRLAMCLRDQRCRAEGCSVPASWCDAHHLRPWSVGGKTDLSDGKLLCSFHHRRIHDRRYEHELLASGDIRFRRRR